MFPPLLADRHSLWHRPFTARLWDVGSGGHYRNMVGCQRVAAANMADSGRYRNFSARHADRHSPIYGGSA